MTRIVVFGGAGFLGSQVSQAALRKGWQVTCISRCGRPAPSISSPPASTSASASASDCGWHDQVDWVRGDAFDTSSFSKAIQSAHHVVSTIGVLDYRGFMNEPRPSRILDKLSLTLRDSLHDYVPSLASRPDSDEALRKYDIMNRDAVMNIADQVARYENVKSLVYVSAADGFPGIPRRYITSKREAENYLTDMKRPFRSILFRPGFMFSDSRGFTKPVARILGLSYALNSSLNGNLPLIGAAGVKPLAVERVGSAIVEACDDDRIEGPIETHQIEALADVRWRAEMIV